MPPSLVFSEPIENPSCLRISRQSGRKREFSFRLRVVTSSYGGYLVANNIRNLPNSEPTPPRAATGCIVACRGPQLQSSRDSRDELIVQKISARDISNTLVAPPTADNEMAYSTHCCRFPSFQTCAVKQLGIRRTVVRALDVPTAKLLPCNITAPVNQSSAKPLTTVVVCTRDSAALCIAPRTEPDSALDLTSTRPVLCAHRVIQNYLVLTIVQVNTRATSRNACEYNSSRTPRSRHLILNLSRFLCSRRRISRLISRDHLLPMSSLLDRFDAAEIFAAASVVAISVNDARNQLQSYSVVDVMIEGLDLRFIDSIAAEGCGTPRLFLKRTLARLPPTLGGVYFAAMIACDEALARCEKQSPESTLSFALVFCFRIRSYYAARQFFAMFNRRFDSRLIAERLSICYVPILH